jgi:hypothetical protein
MDDWRSEREENDDAVETQKADGSAGKEHCGKGGKKKSDGDAGQMFEAEVGERRRGLLVSFFLLVVSPEKRRKRRRRRRVGRGRVWTLLGFVREGPRIRGLLGPGRGDSESCRLRERRRSRSEAETEGREKRTRKETVREGTGEGRKERGRVRDAVNDDGQ